MRRTCCLSLCALAVLAAAPAVRAQQPEALDFRQAHWIGPAAGDTRPTVGFRRGLDLPGAPAVAQLLLSADASFELFVNGVAFGAGHDWTLPQRFDLARLLHGGANLLAVKVDGGGAAPALLAALRVVTADGAVLEIASDTAWQAGAAEPETWSRPEITPAGWGPAGDRGAYGAAPWGRLTRLSAAESQRAMGEIAITIPVEASGAPHGSAFKGKYADPALAERYQSYLGIERESGRFRRGKESAALLFVRYSQPGAGLDHPLLDPAQFDFDLFNADLDLLAANGLQVALQGFGWPDLLAADGTWLKVAKQPKGSGLPVFTYAYEVLDYALDRIQERGLSAMVLLDYRHGLPEGVVAPAYLDKALVAPALWDGQTKAQAKIVAYFADRPVIAGYALAHDSLPPWPQRSEPLMAQAFGEYLQRRYRTIDGLRRAWGPGAPADFDKVPVPAPDDDTPAAGEFGAMRQALLTDRLNTWVAAMRGADPHHLFAFGEADPGTALLEPQRLRFDLYGSFGVQPPAVDPISAPAGGGGLGWDLARSVRALPQAALVGTLSGRCGAGLVGAQAGRAVLTEWAETVADGAAGCITAPTWDRLVGRGAGGGLAPDGVTLGRLAEAVRAMQRSYLAYPARVLVVRDNDAALGHGADAELRSTAHLTAALEQLHLPFDLVAAASVGGAEEAYRVDLGRYAVVLLPKLGRLPDDGFWSAVEAWLAAGAGDRTLVVGRIVASGPLTPLAARVLGGAAAQTPAQAPDGAALLARPPIAGGPDGRRLAFPAGVAVSRVEPAGEGSLLASLKTDATAGDGLPVLVRHATGPGRAIVSAGFDLGLGEVTDLTPEAAESLAYLTGGLLAAAGVTAPLQTAPDISVHLSVDGGQAVVVERSGQDADTLWTAPAQRPESVWGDAQTQLSDNGMVTVQASLAPYQVKLLTAVGELHGVEANQTATVRAGQAIGQGLTLNVQGPAGAMLRLHTTPGGQFAVSSPGGLPQTRQAAPDGTAEVVLADAKPLVVQLYGGLTPPTARIGAPDYLAVANDLAARRDFDGAVKELERLSSLYAGTEVAKLADAQRDTVLRQCGAVVFVNETSAAVLVSYGGPAAGVVEPGGQKRFLLAAGSYDESLQPLVSGATPVTSQARAAVTAGSAVVREYNLASLPAELVKTVGLTTVGAPLSESDRLQLTQAATTAVTPSAPAAPSGPAAGSQSGPGVAAAATEPKRLIGWILAPVQKPKDKAQYSRVTVRNQTSKACVIRAEFHPPAPNPMQHLESAKPIKAGATGSLDTGTEGFSYFWVYFPDMDQLVDLSQRNTDGSTYSFTLKEYTAAEWANLRKNAHGKEIGGIVDTPSTAGSGATTAPSAPPASAAGLTRPSS
jgi:hypothetical protein